jgi:hypothetical protein
MSPEFLRRDAEGLKHFLDRGDDSLEIDVVLPERVIGIDKKNLAMVVLQDFDPSSGQ